MAIYPTKPIMPPPSPPVADGFMARNTKSDTCFAKVGKVSLECHPILPGNRRKWPNNHRFWPSIINLGAQNSCLELSDHPMRTWVAHANESDRLLQHECQAFDDENRFLLVNAKDFGLFNACQISVENDFCL